MISRGQFFGDHSGGGDSELRRPLRSGAELRALSGRIRIGFDRLRSRLAASGLPWWGSSDGCGLQVLKSDPWEVVCLGLDFRLTSSGPGL